MSNPAIKAIIYDIDGMVLTGKRFSEVLDERYDISIETTSDFFRNKFQECLIGKADLREELPKYFKNWGWNDSLDSFIKLWFETDVAIDNKIVESINSLRSKGVKCYLCTNNEKYRTTYLAQTFGFDELFDKVYPSFIAGSKKPELEFFDYVFKAMNSKTKAEVIFWDDDEKNVNGAKEFGFHSELYTSFDDFLNKLTTYGINV
jgi:putative hydrolase of the HAD superfamily